LYRYYDIYGVLTFEGYLQNGKKEGTWTTWYDEVQKQEERVYKGDVLHGTWTYWFIDGNVMKEEFYENGKKIKELNYD
jgi:antitoxin component YwqK of YwqJK toxin-antitoxin module